MAIAMSTASRLFVCTRTHSLDLSARFFSSSGQIRRRKPVRLGRDEARRKIEPKELTQQSEAVTNYQEQLPAEAPFLSNNNAPQNLKTVLKEVGLFSCLLNILRSNFPHRRAFFGV